MKQCKMISMVVLISLTVAARAEVVPNVNAGTAASASFLTFQGGPRSFMFVIDESQLTNSVGMNIVGARFRLNESATVPGPTANMSTTDFEAYIGAGVDPTAISTTVANNFTGSVTQIHDGALAITAGSFGNGNPAPFGPTINLNAWTYSGGDLAIFMTWQAWTGASLTFDAAGTASVGYGTQFAARWTSAFNPTTTGSTGNFIVMDLVTQPVPEPGSILALGAGIAMLALGRRRRK